MVSEVRKVAPPEDRIEDARLQTYRAELRRPWVSTKERIAVRSGWLVRLRTRSGRTGLGDCAPLPSAGTEPPDAARDRLASALPGLTGVSPAEVLGRMPAWPETPAARCALETALVDLVAGSAGIPLARWLRADARAEIPVGLALGTLGTVSADQLAQATDEGYSVIKLKVGLGRLTEEIAALERLAGTLKPGVWLRLDANGAWQEREARQLLGRLQGGLPVESVEEPLAGADSERLSRLQALTDRALALDESLAGRDLADLLARPPVRRLVLKPQVLGGLLPCLELANRAREAGLECVVTSTLEGPVGLWAGVHLAAALGPAPPHGLATGLWLAERRGAPLPREGRIRLPEVPGLGLSRHDVD